MADFDPFGLNRPQENAGGSGFGFGAPSRPPAAPETPYERASKQARGQLDEQLAAFQDQSKTWTFDSAYSYFEDMDYKLSQQLEDLDARQQGDMAYDPQTEAGLRLAIQDQRERLTKYMTDLEKKRWEAVSKAKEEAMLRQDAASKEDYNKVKDNLGGTAADIWSAGKGASNWLLDAISTPLHVVETAAYVAGQGYQNLMDSKEALFGDKKEAADARIRMAERQLRLEEDWKKGGGITGIMAEFVPFWDDKDSFIDRSAEKFSHDVGEAYDAALTGTTPGRWYMDSSQGTKTALMVVPGINLFIAPERAAHVGSMIYGHFAGSSKKEQALLEVNLRKTLSSAMLEMAMDPLNVIGAGPLTKAGTIAKFARTGTGTAEVLARARALKTVSNVTTEAAEALAAIRKLPAHEMNKILRGEDFAANILRKRGIASEMAAKMGQGFDDLVKAELGKVAELTPKQALAEMRSVNGDVFQKYAQFSSKAGLFEKALSTQSQNLAEVAKLSEKPGAWIKASTWEQAIMRDQSRVVSLAQAASIIPAKLRAATLSTLMVERTKDAMRFAASMGDKAMMSKAGQTVYRAIASRVPWALQPIYTAGIMNATSDVAQLRRASREIADSMTQAVNKWRLPAPEKQTVLSAISTLIETVPAESRASVEDFMEFVTRDPKAQNMLATLAPGQEKLVLDVAGKYAKGAEFMFYFQKSKGLNIHMLMDDVLEGYFGRRWSESMRELLATNEKAREMVKTRARLAAEVKEADLFHMPSYNQFASRNARGIALDDLETFMREKLGLDKDFSVFEKNPSKIIEQDADVAGRAVTRMRLLQAYQEATPKLAPEKILAIKEMMEKATQNRRVNWAKKADLSAAAVAGSVEAKADRQRALEHFQAIRDAVISDRSETPRTRGMQGLKTLMEEVQTRVEMKADWPDLVKHMDASEIEDLDKFLAMTNARPMPGKWGSLFNIWIHDQPRSTRGYAGMASGYPGEKGKKGKALYISLFKGESESTTFHEIGHMLDFEKRLPAGAYSSFQKEYRSYLKSIGGHEVPTPGAENEPFTHFPESSMVGITSRQSDPEVVADLVMNVLDSVANGTPMNPELAQHFAGTMSIIKKEFEAGKARGDDWFYNIREQLAGLPNDQPTDDVERSLRKAIDTNNPEEMILNAVGRPDMTGQELDRLLGLAGEFTPVESLTPIEKANFVRAVVGKTQNLSDEEATMLDFFMQTGSKLPDSVEELAGMAATVIPKKHMRDMTEAMPGLKSEEPGKFGKTVDTLRRIWQKQVMARIPGNVKDFVGNAGTHAVATQDPVGSARLAAGMIDRSPEGLQSLKSGKIRWRQDPMMDPLFASKAVEGRTVNEAGKMAEAHAPGVLANFERNGLLGQIAKAAGDPRVLGGTIGATTGGSIDGTDSEALFGAAAGGVLGVVSGMAGRKALRALITKSAGANTRVGSALGALADIYTRRAEITAKSTDFLLNTRKSQEEYFRVAMYLDRVKGGYSPADAVDSVFKTYGNFMEMTKFEKSVLQRWFLFYAWNKHSMSASMRLAFEHPFKARMLAIATAGTIGTQDDPGAWPQWLMGMGGFHIGNDEQGNPAVLSAMPGSIFQPLLDATQGKIMQRWQQEGAKGAFFGSVQASLRSALPMWRVPAEIATQTDMFTNQPFYDPTFRENTADKAPAVLSAPWVPASIKRLLDVRPVTGKNGQLLYTHMDPVMKHLLMKPMPGVEVTLQDAGAAMATDERKTLVQQWSRMLGMPVYSIPQNRPELAIKGRAVQGMNVIRREIEKLPGHPLVMVENNPKFDESSVAGRELKKNAEAYSANYLNELLARYESSLQESIPRTLDLEAQRRGRPLNNEEIESISERVRRSIMPSDSEQEQIYQEGQLKYLTTQHPNYALLWNMAKRMSFWASGQGTKADRMGKIQEPPKVSGARDILKNRSILEQLLEPEGE